MAYKQLNKSKLEIKGYSRVEGYGVFFACFGVGFLVVWLGFFFNFRKESRHTEFKHALHHSKFFFSSEKLGGLHSLQRKDYF